MENTDDDDHHGLLLLIPGDVLIQILVWLPVISLLRFKSVCKSWRALIESSFFIHLHAAVTTTSSSSSNKFGTFIFQTSPLCHTTEPRIFMLTSSNTTTRSGGGDDDEVVFEGEDFGFPPLYKTDLGWWRMVGSCNGLICTQLKRVVSLWNPATRQFRPLPKSSLTTLEEEKEEEVDCNRIPDVFGFGFDVKTKDYKVVQIRTLSLHGKLVEFRVQVYSLSTNSWGMKGSLLLPKTFEGYFTMSPDGLYLNGSFFFKGIYYGFEEDTKIRHWILSFDCTKEIFTPIKQFPDDLVDSSSALTLTYFGAHKIAFLVKSCYYYSSSREEEEEEEEERTDLVYDIWVLNNEKHDQEKEEEEESYWTKLQHSIRITTGYSSWIIPRTRGDDDDDEKDSKVSKLQLFNLLVTKEEKTVFVFPTGIGFQSTYIYNYKRSLVSVVGGGGNGNGTAASSSSSSSDNRVVQCEHLVKPYCCY